MTVNILSRLFGRSPFGPLQAHMEKGLECSRHLRPFFEAMLASELEKAKIERKTILELEHQADKIKNEIRDNLPKTVFLPVDRRDLLELLSMQDRIPDSTEDAVITASLRPLTLPESLMDTFLDFLKTVEVTAEACGKVFKGLDRLVEGAFSGPEAEQVMDELKQVGHLEWESDKAQYRLAKEILAAESTLGTMNTILWMRVVARLAGLANAAENACDRLRLMLSV